MITAVELIEAAMALREQFGPRLAASRQGGRQRLAAALCRKFAIEAGDAQRVVATLERRKAIVWEPEPGISRPCPGTLELFGDWRIRPEHLQESEHLPDREKMYLAVRAEPDSSAITLR
jgi:hypothetical protein